MPEVEKVNPYRDDTRSKDAQVQSMFDAIAPAYVHLALLVYEAGLCPPSGGSPGHQL